MSLSLMQVFNQFIMPATIETLAQQIDKFNQASAGAIVLSTEGFTGDYMQASFWNAIHAAQRRVNRYAAQAAVTPTDLSQYKQSSVKIAGGFGPIRFEPSQLTWLQKASAEAIEVTSRNMAEAIMADMLNTSIAALCGAIGNNANLVNDVSGSANVSLSSMNDAHAKFGDASGQLVATIMSGLMYHKLIGQNITNNNRLFVQGDITVVESLGKRVIVTDAPALRVAGTPNKQRVLSLQVGAATVMDAGDMITNVQTNNGLTRIETTFQADYTFGLGLLGYTWDETNGGKSPTDAALATGTNWDQVVGSVKHTAGVMTIGNEAL